MVNEIDSGDEEVLLEFFAVASDGRQMFAVEPCFIAGKLQMSYERMDECLQRLEEAGMVSLARHNMPAVVNGISTARFYPTKASSVALTPSGIEYALARSRGG